MRTKYLCVLIHIKINGEVGTLNHVKPSSILTGRSKAALILWILFVICVSCLSLLCRVVCFLQPCDNLLGKD